jgi:DNA-binding XRE family transcriptional regulator
MTISNNISVEEKRELCKLMASNLSVLREKAKIKQDELADRLGISRQTISAIENDKREMQWSTFSVLLMFFANDDETRRIMVAMEIINEAVEKIFNV